MIQIRNDNGRVLGDGLKRAGTVQVLASRNEPDFKGGKVDGRHIVRVLWIRLHQLPLKISMTEITMANTPAVARISHML